ncbi:aminodeoxychorismate synthase component I [Acidihalobacter prosperus]
MPLQRPLPGLDDLLWLHELNPERYPHLLQSVTPGGANARYDILFAFPESTLIDRVGNNFINWLDNTQLRLLETNPTNSDIPFNGGWFLYIGYELGHALEPKLGLPQSHPWNWPAAAAQYCPAAVIVDHAEPLVYAIAVDGREDLLGKIAEDAARASVQRECRKFPTLKLTLQESPVEPYLEGIIQIKEYITRGDIFQANLSRSWKGVCDNRSRPSEIYARLRQANPAPFAGLATLGSRAIISSSPERLVSYRDGWLSTRPIAGTRPRGIDTETDQEIMHNLVMHPKERAEHIMLIDLERNDLGRIAKTGTVEVNELMVLETYAHVHHIVSNVRARLAENTSVGDLIRAIFPGGTITGCPKIRCMEILQELECTARGAYTGAMGYLGDNGQLDLNILIRSLEWDNGEFRFRTGAGIVYDSDPESELSETKYKAEGLVRALR